MSIGRILGGLVAVGLVTACGGTSRSGEPQATAGSGGAAGTGAAGLASAGSNAGTAGSVEAVAGAFSAGEGGAGGEAGAADGSAGLGGEAGAGGTAGADGVELYPPIDIGPQQTSEKLDVLFVVDNSVSMSDKQNILKVSLPSFMTRLANPLCVDGEGRPVETQPTSGTVECITGRRELRPVKDMHVGVITSSLGSHGGNVCSTPSSPDEHLDDRGQLLPAQRANLPSYNDAGYLAYDAAGLVGVSDVGSVIADLQTVVNAVGERGCGYEAPLEAMYRFLVDPEPPASVAQVNGQTTPSGIDATLLTQRNAFLRPDSAVAIVILSDENDCSIRDDSVGWFVGSQNRMPRSTSTCDVDVNDPCCLSCAQSPNAIPAGCPPVADDVSCKNVSSGAYATWDPLHDSLNLRCFDQRRRFGFDLLYPVERYSDALSNPRVRNRARVLVDNPLLAARDGKGPRSASLISVSVIVGAPWQDLVIPTSLNPGYALTYLDGAGLESYGRWPLLIGDPAHGKLPSDPFMIESPYERTGQNPLTQAPIVASTSTNPLANAINGHEQNLPSLDDLQFACTFPLLTPKPCAAGDFLCECSPDRTGNSAAVQLANSPLCQPPGGGAATTTQYYGRGYPGTRELRFARLLGERALPASICPKTLTDTSSPDYAYNPAFRALFGRIAKTLK